MVKKDKLKCYTLKANDGHIYTTCDDKSVKKPKKKKVRLVLKQPKEAATDAMNAIKEVRNISGSPKLKKQFIERLKAEIETQQPANTTAKPKPKSPLRGGVGLRPEISKLVQDFARPRGARKILFDDKTFDIYQPKSWSFKQFKKVISSSGFLARVGDRIEEKARGEYMGRYPVNHAGDYLYRDSGNPSNEEEGGELQKKEYDNFKLNLEKYLWRLIKHPVYQNRIINQDLYNVPPDELSEYEDKAERYDDLNWMITGFNGLDYLFKPDVISQMNYLMEVIPRYGDGYTEEDWLKKPPFSGRIIKGRKGDLERVWLGGASALKSETPKNQQKLKKQLVFFRKYGSLKNS